MKLKRGQQGHIGSDGPGSDDEPWKWSWVYAFYAYVLGIFVSFLLLAVWVVPECQVKQWPALPLRASNIAVEAWLPSLVWPISWVAYYAVYRATGSLCGSGLDKEKS